MLRLAERLGYTARELGERMTTAELRDWLALDRVRAAKEPERKTPITLEQARATMKKSIRHAKA